MAFGLQISSSLSIFDPLLTSKQLLIFYTIYVWINCFTGKENGKYKKRTFCGDGLTHIKVNLCNFTEAGQYTPK